MKKDRDDLRVVSLHEASRCAEVVEFVEDLLVRAKGGEIEALAVAIVESDGSTNTAWAWDKGVDSARLVGGSTVLTSRLLAALDPES